MPSLYGGCDSAGRLLKAPDSMVRKFGLAADAKRFERLTLQILLIRRDGELVDAVVFLVAAVAGDARVFHLVLGQQLRPACATNPHWQSARACFSLCVASRWLSIWAAIR